MTEDVKVDIQPVVSDGATTVPEVKAEVKPPTTEELITQKISEATKSFTEQVEASKREIQSLKDKHKSELERAQREAQMQKETFSAFKGNLGEIDPEVATKMELAEYKARDKALQTEAQREQSLKQQNETLDKFNSNISQFITDAGLDPNDKRIDWGADSQTLLEKQQKILASVAKIHKANAKDAEEKLSKTVKDEIAKARKELGLDSVDTSHPAGVGTSSKSGLNKRYANGEISYKEYEEGLKKL